MSRPLSGPKWCLGVLLGLSVQGACASGNWIHFRPETYERAQGEDDHVIRASTYDAITKVQELSAKGQHVDALDHLSDLESQVQAVPKERALFYQAKAYVLMTMGRFHEAPEAIEKALEPDTLPEPTAQDLRYNLAQIYAQQEQFQKAAPALEMWIAQSDRPDPQAVALLAYIYHEDKQFELAIRYIKQALAQKPGELDWRKILLSSELALKRYAPARKSVLALLSSDPLNPEHWRTLNQLDLLLEHPDDALVSLDVVQDLAQLQASELLQLVRLRMLQGLPFQGAQMLHQALETRQVQDSAEHWSLLGHAYLASQEFAQASQAFEQSLQRQDLPEKRQTLCLRLAGLAMRTEQWSQAQRHASCAEQSSNRAQRANAALIDGIASYQHRDFERSLQALGRARGFDQTKASAASWEDMVRVQRENLKLISSQAQEGLAR